MAKTLKINMNKVGWSGSSYSFDAKGANKIAITYNGTVSEENFTKIKVSGSTLVLKLCGQWTYKLNNLSDPSKIRVTIKRDNGVVQYDDSLQNFFEYMSGNIETWRYDAKKKLVTGTIFADDIDVSDETKYKKGLTINANTGDDTIIGTAGNDTIKGGAGENLIKLYTTKDFGNDVVELTKKENLILQVADQDEVNSYENYTNVYLNGNNLVIDVYNGVIDRDGLGNPTNLADLHKTGSVTVKNYTKTDVMTSEGYFGLTDANPSTEYRSLRGINRVTVLNGNVSKFTGSWIDDNVDASEYVARYKNGGEITKNTDTVKGVNVNLGNSVYLNYAVGSKYADTITGGNNDDAIYGGKGNDVIVGNGGYDNLNGQDGNDNLSGGAGEDLLVGGKGNDTLSGGSGNDTFSFTQEDGGVDTIVDAAKGDLILISDVLKTDLRYAKNGNNLEIFYDDSYDINNKIVIKNHFKTKANKRITMLQAQNQTEVDLSTITIDALSGSGKFNGTNASDLLIGSGKADTIKAGKGDDTVYGYTGNDVIYGENGNDTISGGLGNDKLYGGAGENKFMFSEGDGVDTVYSNGGADTLQFNNFNTLDELKDGVTLLSDGSSLKIKYTDSDVAVVDKFYKNKTNSVKYVADKDGNQLLISELVNTINTVEVNGSGTITGTKGNDKIKGSAKADTIKALAGNDTISALGGNDNIYGGLGNDVINAGAGKNNIFYSLGDGDDVILNGGGTDTLVFDKGTKVVATYVGNDLVVTYSGAKGGVDYSNTITIDDFKSGSSVKNVKIGSTTKTIDKYINGGGGGSSTTYISTADDEEWATWNNNIKVGNHTFVYDLANVDPVEKHFGYDLIFSPNTSATGGTDTFVFNNHAIQRHGNEFSIGAHYGNDGLDFRIWNAWDTIGGGPKYLMVAERNATVIVQDTDATYTLKAYRDDRTINNLASSLNNITLIEAGLDKTATVISNNKYNYTVTNKTNLNYTYNGGHDRVDTSISSNDTYNINTLTTTSVITIDEQGGTNDTLNFKNTNADDIRVLFNVTRYSPNDIEYSLERNLFVHKDAVDLENLKGAVKYAGPVDVRGVFVYDYYAADGGNGIDNISALGVEQIDKDAWYNAVAQSIGEWLETYHYESVEDALWGDNPCTGAPLDDLLERYASVKYSEVVQDPEFIPPSRAGECEGTDGNDKFISSAADETFILKKGNDTVTFGGVFGSDTITTESIANRGNTDTLIFTNHAFTVEDNDLLARVVQDYDEPTQYNLVIQDALGENTVTYHDFLGANAPKLKITDTKGTYVVNGYSTAQALIDNSKDTKNHMEFVVAENGSTTIKANNKANFATVVGSSLNYTYNGGNDSVITESDTNDTYNITSITKSTKLAIADNGGTNDTVNITATASDLRLFIDVDREGHYDVSNIAFIHKDNFTVGNIDRIYAGYNAPGAHIYAYGTGGIENINLNGVEVNKEAWYGQVAQSVSTWLSGTTYDSASEAIAAYADNPDSVNISGLVAAYQNVHYNNIA